MIKVCFKLSSDSVQWILIYVYKPHMSLAYHTRCLELFESRHNFNMCSLIILEPSWLQCVRTCQASIDVQQGGMQTDWRWIGYSIYHIHFQLSSSDMDIVGYGNWYPYPQKSDTNYILVIWYGYKSNMWETNIITDRLNGYAYITIYLSLENIKCNAITKYYDKIEKSRQKNNYIFLMT